MRLDLEALADYRPRTIPSEPAEQAGVLVPIIDRGDHHVLFTERAAHLPIHGGEMSFPGGGREDDDADLTATALREAHEEVGIRPSEVTVVGRLDDVPGPYGHVVRPIVGRVADRAYGSTSPEVEEVVVISVARLADAANYSREEHSHPERGTATLPFFRAEGHVIWGLTGFVLQELLRLTTDRTPESP